MLTVSETCEISSTLCAAVNIAAVQRVCRRVWSVRVQTGHHPLCRPSRPGSCWNFVEGDHRQTFVFLLFIVRPARWWYEILSEHFLYSLLSVLQDSVTRQFAEVYRCIFVVTVIVWWVLVVLDYGDVHICNLLHTKTMSTPWFLRYWELVYLVWQPEAGLIQWI